MRIYTDMYLFIYLYTGKAARRWMHAFIFYFREVFLYGHKVAAKTHSLNLDQAAVS